MDPIIFAIFRIESTLLQGSQFKSESRSYFLESYSFFISENVPEKKEVTWRLIKKQPRFGKKNSKYSLNIHKEGMKYIRV